MSFYKLYDYDEPDINIFVMDTKGCFDIFETRLEIFDIAVACKEFLLNETEGYINEIVIDIKEGISKQDYFYLARFYHKSTDMFNQFKANYRTDKYSTIAIKEVSQYICDCNKEFGIQVSYIEDLIGRVLKKYKEKRFRDRKSNGNTMQAKGLNMLTNSSDQMSLISDRLSYRAPTIVTGYLSNNNINEISQDEIPLELLISFFMMNKFVFKISINKFIDICLNHIVTVFKLIEKKMQMLYEKYDYEKIGKMKINEFETMLIENLVSPDYKWKIKDYFE